MGLDISAYRGLTKAQGNEAFDETGEAREGWIQFRMDGLSRADEFEDGHCYRAEDAWGFRAGSYSGYNSWRESLAKLAGYPSVEVSWYRDGSSHAASAWSGTRAEGAESRPFYELVDFSDCEGLIGTAVSAKLAADFAAFQEQADKHPDAWFREKYADWRRAFEMASDRGAVEFH